MQASDFPDRDKPFSQEGYALIGASFEVHNEIGGGLLEEIYQETLEIELTSQSIPFVAKGKIPIHYKGRRLKKTYQPDLLVFGEIVVELKAVEHLSPTHRAQLINYMRLANKPIGYLINFAPIKAIEWERFILSEFLK